MSVGQGISIGSHHGGCNLCTVCSTYMGSVCRQVHTYVRMCTCSASATMCHCYRACPSCTHWKPCWYVCVLTCMPLCCIYVAQSPCVSAACGGRGCGVAALCVSCLRCHGKQHTRMHVFLLSLFSVSLDLSQIKAYIDSFRYGAPPHAGGGIGKPA